MVKIVLQRGRVNIEGNKIRRVKKYRESERNVLGKRKRLSWFVNKFHNDGVMTIKLCNKIILNVSNC